jgi:hypothetical protein
MIARSKALLANATRQVLGDLGPLFGAELSDELRDPGVLLLGPGAFDERRIEHFLVTMQALNVGLAGQCGGDLFPVFAFVFGNLLAKNFVLSARK